MKARKHTREEISRSRDARARSARTRKCERYARERHANVKSLHACVFLLSNSEKLIEKTFETTLRQNNTKIWAAYGKTVLLPTAEMASIVLFCILLVVLFTSGNKYLNHSFCIFCGFYRSSRLFTRNLGSIEAYPIYPAKYKSKQVKNIKISYIDFILLLVPNFSFLFFMLGITRY